MFNEVPAQVRYRQFGFSRDTFFAHERSSCTWRRLRPATKPQRAFKDEKGKFRMNKVRGILGILACLLLLPVAAYAESDSSRLNKERLKVGRALVEVTPGTLATVVPYYAHDIEYHDPIVDVYGIDQMIPFLYRISAASPDLITLVEEETSIDGIYSATWTMIGTFAGVPYEAKGMSIIKFRDKSTSVYYQRDYYTEGDIMIAIDPLKPVICGFRGVYRSAVNPDQAPDPECLSPP
jgi:hypothetical protein